MSADTAPVANQTQPTPSQPSQAQQASTASGDSAARDLRSSTHRTFQGRARTAPTSNTSQPTANQSTGSQPPSGFDQSAEPSSTSDHPPFEASEDSQPYYGPLIEEELYSWMGPSRPFKKRNRKYFTTIFTIVLLISLILFFAGQVPVVAVVIAVGFVAYVFATIPPHMIRYQFTTYGVRIDSQIFYWEELGRFWFAQIHGQRVLHFEVMRFPGRLTLVLKNVDEAEIQSFLSQLLLQQQPEPDYYERVAMWLQKYIPLDLEA